MPKKTCKKKKTVFSPTLKKRVTRCASFGGTSSAKKKSTGAKKCWTLVNGTKMCSSKKSVKGMKCKQNPKTKMMLCSKKKK